MLIDKKPCPDCQTKLEVVVLSDLLAETNEPGLDATFKLIRHIFGLFIFYVCSNCGKTLVYAGPEVKGLAAEGNDELIGIS